MMETGGKRGKSKYSKILTAMHPNRDLSVGAPLPRAGNPAPASAPSGGSKKKKRKSGGGSHKSKAAVVDPVHSSGGGGGGDLAPHIAEIIERNGGTASLDTIVEGYAATGPPVGMDGDELRSKIQKIIAFSRKPYRFPRHPDRKTYSVEKVA